MNFVNWLFIGGCAAGAIGGFILLQDLRRLYLDDKLLESTDRKYRGFDGRD